MSRLRTPLALTLAMVCSAPWPAAAQWVPNGAPLCTATGNQQAPFIASDGNGGAIVVWYDQRNETGICASDIYAQRVNAAGVRQWGADGVAVCTAPGAQLYPTVVADGRGGAIVVWTDQRSNCTVQNLYAQRLNANGQGQWGTNGVPLCRSGAVYNLGVVAPDGDGGAIVAWDDLRRGNLDIYVQRITSGGGIPTGWAPNGDSMCVAVGDQRDPAIAADGAAGVIVAWQDLRGATPDVYAQRVNGAGVRQWALNGVPACMAPNEQSAPKVAADGVGGAFVAWSDLRNADADLYAAHLQATGGLAVGWTANGDSVGGAPGDQTDPLAVADGAGGAIIAWVDEGLAPASLRAQRVGPSGSRLWTPTGVILGAYTVGCYAPIVAVGDGTGGALLVWAENRNNECAVWAQRVSAGGVPLWGPDGVQVCTTWGVAPNVTTSGSGAAIVTWEDYRGPKADIYAQMVSADGHLPSEVGVPAPPVAAFQLLPARPNPSRGITEFGCTLPAAATLTVDVFDLAGRAVRRLADARPFDAGTHTLVWDGRAEGGGSVPSGVYIVYVRGAGAARAIRLALLR